MGDVQPQDADSSLAKREWVRTSRRRSVATKRTLEGETVEATWMDWQGHVRHAGGAVVRDHASDLAIEHTADGEQRWSAVTRNANVDMVPRR